MRITCPKCGRPNTPTYYQDDKGQRMAMVYCPTCDQTRIRFAKGHWHTYYPLDDFQELAKYRVSTIRHGSPS